MRGGNDAMALSPFLSVLYTCLGNWFPSGMKDCTVSVPDWISALPIFKENVMGSGLLLNFLRGFENFPVAVFPYSHFLKTFNFPFFGF